jgi:hypothetical protein
MRIGGNDNFLLIEKRDANDVYSPWRVEAVATASGQKFSMVHDRVILDASEKTLRQFADFEALKTDHIKIPLSEGGWLNLERQTRGYITVHFRVLSTKLSAALDGAVVVEGDYASGFCRELGALLSRAT